MLSERVASGRVLQVNVSGGGVPKDSVPAARVGQFGLDGDRHRANTVHGGPLRAVCLLGVEVIERLQVEGHPIFPGSVGENVTTMGIELSDLPAGTRLAIGDEVVLEVTVPTMPCDTIVRSFRDGKSGRISILLHPHDSRMYARTLREGVIRPGDPIAVVPADPASDVAVQADLFRIESAVRNRHIALWRAAVAAGHDVDVVDDGELAVATSRELPGRPFNLAFGLRSLPQFLPLVLERFRDREVAGSFAASRPPWPGAAPIETIATFTREPDALAPHPTVEGVEVREATRDDVAGWRGGATGPWATILPALAANHATRTFVASEGSTIVGSALLFTHRRIGLLAGASVEPAARGRGIHRALIVARARRAAELGCDLLVVEAALGNEPSLRNVERARFRELTSRVVYCFDPMAPDADAQIAAARAGLDGWEPARLPGPLAHAHPG